jgi:hypothetical protein
MADLHGLTANSNLTFSRSLGAGGYGSGIGVPVDMWNIPSMYGRQPFDINWIYNLSMYYRPKMFKSSGGVLRQLTGGWGFAPLFTAQSGAPLGVTSSSNCQSFGQANCSYLGGTEQAIAIGPVNGGNEAHYGVSSNGVAGQNGNASRGGSGLNMFADPSAVFSNFRRDILGVDTRVGGAGPLRGFPTWNLDFAVMKDIKIRESIGATLSFQFVNVLNHFQPANPSLSIDNPGSFGVVTTQANAPRQIEFGLKLFWFARPLLDTVPPPR